MTEEIHKQWNPFIILISYSVSALGSYTTLQIISQTRSSSASMFTVQMWLLFASLSFGGCAVWSMHFLGMMALDLGIKVGYEPVLTIVSLCVPVAASRIAFEFMQFSSVRQAPRRLCDDELTPDPSDSESVGQSEEQSLLVEFTETESATLVDESEGSPTMTDSAVELGSRRRRKKLGLWARIQRIKGGRVWTGVLRLTRDLLRVPCWRILVGGLFLAAGICAMHYIGMMAMRMNARVTWHGGYIVASIFIAWLAASSSLYIVSFCYLLWQHFIAALLMSLAVCGMHYVGMAAATYYTTDEDWEPSGTSQNFASLISIFSTVTSFIFFGLASGSTTMARDRLEQEIELRKTMEKLMLDKEAAELADRTKSAFVATVSHEIRTPMNIIIGATELLTATKQNEEQKDLTNTIQASSRGLLNMINDILDFSKLNNNRMQLEILGFSPLEVVEDIVSMSVIAVTPDVDLLLRVTNNARVRVLGDPVRFQQVIMNIVSNASKFTKQGHILLDMWCSERNDDRCNLVISIEDSGIGISQEACEKIFEPFVQADSSYARRFGGTGLGLSVCKQLMDLMGGTINVKSTVNKGTTFQCTFPFALDSVQPEYNSHKDEFSGLKCFLACRNTRSRDVIKSYLIAWGISVQAMEDRTPKNLNFTQFDIIMLDFELLLKIRVPPDCDKPVIIMNSTRQKSANGMPARTILLRRPVFEERLFSAVLQAIKAQGSSPIAEFRTPQHSPATAQRHTSPTSNEKRVMRVLLVEDNRLVQQIAIRLLQRLGLDVDVADNGLEAVEQIKKESYDAILMDCQMPVMDGFTATKNIRQYEREQQLPSTKIIALTAGVSEELKQECLSVGMDSYITKPVTLHMLKTALELDTRTEKHITKINL